MCSISPECSRLRCFECSDRRLPAFGRETADFWDLLHCERDAFQGRLTLRGGCGAFQSARDCGDPMMTREGLECFDISSRPTLPWGRFSRGRFSRSSHSKLQITKNSLTQIRAGRVQRRHTRSTSPSPFDRRTSKAKCIHIGLHSLLMFVRPIIRFGTCFGTCFGGRPSRDQSFERRFWNSLPRCAGGFQLERGPRTCRVAYISHSQLLHSSTS
jgi:hypothetical protein